MRLSSQMSFEWLRNCEPCLAPRRINSSQHKLLKPKYREAKLKSTRKWIFLTLKDIMNFSWLPLEAFTAFCLETTFLISKPFQFFRKSTIFHFSSSKVRCSRFLGRLLGSFFAFYFVVLKNFKIDVFNWYFVMPSRSAPAHFNSLKLKLMFLSSRLLSIVT